MNGTSAMTGIGIVNLIHARQRSDIADPRRACMINERRYDGTYADHFFHPP
jgi:hypothetical protein